MPSQGGKRDSVALLKIAVEPGEFMLVGRVAESEAVFEKRERLHHFVARQLFQL
jgi:hypothetical protein